VVINRPDEAAQQAADERERPAREEDELLGERTRQNWEGVSSNPANATSARYARHVRDAANVSR
jgi:hypothetical protein